MTGNSISPEIAIGRRSSALRGDDKGVSAEPEPDDAPRALLALYDEALPAVYGYFVRRCGDRGTAEDLTSETFLAAMDAARKEAPPPITVPWLIGVARHKLADHYRRRSDRFTVPVAELPEPVEPADELGRRARPDRRRERAGQTTRAAPHRAGTALHGRLQRARMRRADRPHAARHRSPAGAGPSRVQIALPGAGRRDVMNGNSHDPLTVLHGDELPVQPDPAFAARLRARLESAVNFFEHHPNRTQGVDMSGTDTAIAELNEPAEAASAAPPRPAALPYLSVANARDAIAWYVDTLGASLVGEPYEMDDGRIGHAELAHRWRRALPRRRVSRDRPESTCAASDFGEPDAAGGRHRRHPRAGSGTRRHRAAGALREPRRPQRHHHRPVRAPVDAQRTRSPARRSRSSTATSGTCRCGRRTPTAPPRSTATCSGWTYDPQTHQVTNTRAAHRHLLRRPDRPRCSAATR